MKWFEGIETLKALTKRVAELAKIYHPDTGTGDAEIMKAINAKYNELKKHFKELKDNPTAENPHSEYYSEFSKAEEYDFTNAFYNASCKEQEDNDFDNEMYSYEVKFIGKKNALEFLKGLFKKFFKVQSTSEKYKVRFIKITQNQLNKDYERYCRGKIRLGAVWRSERR